MWPFNSILLNRIKDLERNNESLIGANQVLSAQLEKAEQREATLQAKLFEVSGITERVRVGTAEVKQSQPIKLHQKTSNWNGIKESLEAKTKREYWEGKKRESESKDKVNVIVDELEKEVLKSEIN